MQFSLKGKNKEGLKGAVASSVPIVFREAEDEYAEAVNSSEGECERLEILGVSQAEQGDYRSAIKSFKQCLSIRSNNFKVLEMIAQIYLETDQVLLALQSAEAAVECQPEWMDGLHTLARCQREIGEVLLSKNTYEKLLAMESTQELLEEFAEVSALVERLENKKDEQLNLLQDAQNESEQEVRRCMYHLCHRAQTDIPRTLSDNTSRLNPLI